MRRFTDTLTGTLAGMLIGVVLMSSVIGTRSFYWSKEPWEPTPRPSQHADPGPGTPGMTTEPRLPSPDDAGRTGAPSPLTVAAIGTRPALPTAAPDLVTLRGIATWYDYRRGHAAAGPELRRALGAGWRGTSVLVCADRCVSVVLSDWCACGNGRVIDLDRASFAVLAPPSVGVLRVTVTLGAPPPPDTSTED